MGQSRAIRSLATTVTVLIATPVAAQAPEKLDNPHGWPCPPGYGRSETTCYKLASTRRSAEREAMAARTAEKWQAELAKEQQKITPEAIEARRRAEAAAEDAERRRMAEEEIPTRRAWAAREEQRRAEEVVAAARQSVAEEERRVAAEKAKLPANRLFRAYINYSHVQLCNEVRQGYAVTYINAVELQRARAASKAIEKVALAEDSTINPDKTFAEADKIARSMSLGSDACRSSLAFLLSMSPVSPYQTQRP